MHNYSFGSWVFANPSMMNSKQSTWGRAHVCILSKMLCVLWRPRVRDLKGNMIGAWSNTVCSRCCVSVDGISWMGWEMERWARESGLFISSNQGSFSAFCFSDGSKWDAGYPQEAADDTRVSIQEEETSLAESTQQQRLNEDRNSRSDLDQTMGSIHPGPSGVPLTWLAFINGGSGRFEGEGVRRQRASEWRGWQRPNLIPETGLGKGRAGRTAVTGACVWIRPSETWRKWTRVKSQGCSPEPIDGIIHVVKTAMMVSETGGGQSVWTLKS